MASVESVKAASDVYAPVSGTVKEVNKVLSDTPALVNESAEDKAWFVKLEVGAGAAAETAAMLQEAAYKKHCEEAAKHH
jgi:glycine cleavage system H protein